MKVSIFGGTGFVGGYLIQELIRNGMIPRVLVRTGSESKIISELERVTGRIEDQNAIAKTIDGTEAVIYNIGIIREYLSKGVTFAELHLKGVKSCIELANKNIIKGNNKISNFTSPNISSEKKVLNIIIGTNNITDIKINIQKLLDKYCVLFLG